MSEAAELSPSGFDHRIGRDVRTSNRVAEAVLELGERMAQLVVHSETSWASIAFAGSRHRFELDFVGKEAVEAAERFIAALPEHVFTIRGQLVAEARITSATRYAGYDQLDEDGNVERVVQPSTAISCELLLLEES